MVDREILASNSASQRVLPSFSPLFAFVNSPRDVRVLLARLQGP